MGKLDEYSADELAVMFPRKPEDRKPEPVGQHVLEVLLRVRRGMKFAPRLGSAVVAARRRGLITEYPYQLTEAGIALLSFCEPAPPLPGWTKEGIERMLRGVYGLDEGGGEGAK